MRRLMVRYIIMIMAISGCILIGLFYFINNERKENVEIKYLDTTVQQVISVLSSNQEKDEEAEKLFQRDYVNRIQTLAYVIAETFHNNPSNTNLKRLAQKMEFRDIHIVNSKGIVTKSTQKSSLGLDFYKFDELKDFIPLIESKTKDEYYVSMTGYNVSEQEEMIYIGIKPFNSTDGMIQVSVDTEALAAYKNKSDIKYTIESMPTREHETIFVLNGTTGELLGISQNNEQSIMINGSNRGEEYINILKEYINESGQIRINDKEQLIAVDESNGNLIVVASDIVEIHRSSSTYSLMISILLFFLSIIIVYAVYKLLDYFILNDLERIVFGVNEFVSGNTNIEFKANKKTELATMADGLNKWVKVIESKSERSSKIVAMMGNTFATYEYYDDLHQVFYSDNLPSMLEISPEECEKIIFERFSEAMQQGEHGEVSDQPEGDLFITKSGRYLNIQRIISGNIFYALVRDVSEERKEREKLSNELQEANEKASKDVLTGLYNRIKAKELIDHWFERGEKEGVMLLMDLDNFKKVNDQKGHPEGDILLKKFAKILTVQFRNLDIKARIGGDEFVVFLSNSIERSILETKINEFLVCCRQELHKYYVEQKLSVSIGIAYASDDVCSYEALYQCSDSAMYIAKRQGKDGFYINESNTSLDCEDNTNRNPK